MNNFQSAISSALSTLQNHVGQEVEYWRGDEWVRVSAVAGKTDFEIDDGNGVIVEYRSRDYLIKSCALILGDTAIEPKRGDLVKETVGAKQYVYEVGRPDGSEMVWRFSDFARDTVRVHTKLREVVDL